MDRGLPRQRAESGSAALAVALGAEARRRASSPTEEEALLGSRPGHAVQANVRVVTTSRPRSKRGEGDALRDALLGAATRLLDASGDVDGLSVRAVTSAAGVSPTALYLHFGDKAALVHAVKIECLAEMSAAVRAARAAHDGDPEAQLIAMGESYLRYAEEHPGHYAMLFHTEVSTDERHDPSDDVQRASRAALHLLYEVLRERLDDGRRAHEATMTLWTGLHGRAHLRKAVPWVDLGDQGRYLASLVQQALRS